MLPTPQNFHLVHGHNATIASTYKTGQLHFDSGATPLSKHQNIKNTVSGWLSG